MERIVVEGISKKFNVGKAENKSALGKVLHLFSKKEKVDILKNINLKLNSKEILGIIGRNGCGKSTLLRIIAGIYSPDKGNIKTQGRLIYLSGYGIGLKPRLTMKENIFLVSSIMGLGQKDIREKFNEIVEFSGLKDYVNTEVYKFSSGMTTRLNFSIAIHCLKHQNPEILLLDEVFGSGGDIDFQNKALNKMEELIKGGAAVILVSHSLDVIKKYCNKAILIDKGEIIKQGLPEEVVNFYLSQNK